MIKGYWSLWVYRFRVSGVGLWAFYICGRGKSTPSGVIHATTLFTKTPDPLSRGNVDDVYLAIIWVLCWLLFCDSGICSKLIYSQTFRVQGSGFRGRLASGVWLKAWNWGRVHGLGFSGSLGV